MLENIIIPTKQMRKLIIYNMNSWWNGISTVINFYTMVAYHYCIYYHIYLVFFQQHICLSEIPHLTYVAFNFPTLALYTWESKKLQWDTGRMLKWAKTIERTTIQVVQLGCTYGKHIFKFS